MSCFSRYILYSLFYALFPFVAVAQEQREHYQVTWTGKDTVEIRELIGQGHKLMHSSPDSALYLFRRALYNSLHTGFEDGAGYALSYIGFVQAGQGNIESAFASYSEALGYCQNARYFKFALPGLYINMAATYKSIGRYEQAAQYYNDALSYLQQNLPQDMNILIVYSNLASLHVDLNQLSRAMMYAQQAESLSVARNNLNTLVSSKANIGAIYTLMKMPDSAYHYLEDALELSVKLGHADKQQFILMSIGDLYRETGQMKKAIVFYEKAVRLNRYTNLVYSSILPSYALGDALMRTGRYRKAESVLLEALQLSNRTGITSSRTEAFKSLSAVYEATGRFKDALAYYKKYERLNDSLSGIAKASAISDAEIRYQVGQKDKLIVENNLKLVKREKELERNRLYTLVALTAGALIAAIVGILFYYRNKMDKRNRHMTYMKAVMEGEERERDRVARELHDGIGGMLTAMQLNIGALMEHKSIRPTELTGLSFLATHIGEEVHKAARNLTPQILQDHNLYQAVLHYCEQFEKSSTLNIQLEFMGEVSHLGHSLQLIIFRIIQELIQNIYKHANAGMAVIQFRTDGGKMYLSAEDNGCGFDPGTVKEGLGLQHIRNRIAALNGFCSIESMPGKGTAIYIEIDQKDIPN